MNKLRTVIIDDERPAINLLSAFVNKVPFLDLKLATTNAFEALELLNSPNIDLLFLDIEMPDITGIELINTLENPPMVVFTTAYEQYALQGYELDVLDYLVKPIRFERFLKAANKANKLFSKEQATTPLAQKDFIDVKVDYQTVRIQFDDILYVEGLKDYVKIHTKDKMILTRLNLKGIQNKLSDINFVRIHRSYIVSLSKITSYNKSQIFIGKTQISIGESYRDNFISKLG